MMLAAIKGPCSYKEIKTIVGVEYPTFREACFAMGFLHDGRKYIEAIKEVNNQGSCLTKLNLQCCSK